MTPVQYKFTNLNEINDKETYNLIAVVKYFQEPKKTKGTGFKTTISITDPSLGYDQRLVCNIFNNKPENLPRISSRGDVIIIHRLKITTFNGKFQGTGSNQGFAVAVIRHDDGANLLNGSYDNLSNILVTNSACFNVTKNDFERAKEMMLWANDMPQSQDEESHAEINVNAMHFSTLSVIEFGETVSLAVQIISVILIDEPPYQSMILVWDATKPNYDLNKNFITALSQATNLKHSISLMAKFGGKLSNPYITCVMFKESIIELKQSFVQPDDYVYLSGITISAAMNGPGVMLVGDQCQIGHLPAECPLYAELTTRLNLFTRHTPIMADCISADIATLQSFHLKDYDKMLHDLTTQKENVKESYCFKLCAKVAKVYPSNEKEFFESVLLYCVSCNRFKGGEGVSGGAASADGGGEDGCDCRGSYVVPVPMVTVTVEDFTGWLTVAMVGRAVMGLTGLVMIESTQRQWWAKVYLSRDSHTIRAWLTHIQRLTRGWIEAKMVFRRAKQDQVLPFIEEVVIMADN